VICLRASRFFAAPGVIGVEAFEGKKNTGHSEQRVNPVHRTPLGGRCSDLFEMIRNRPGKKDTIARNEASEGQDEYPGIARERGGKIKA
jgi:hypothetical protein